MYVREITLQPNIGITIETHGNSLGADTVLHVTDAEGRPLISNDDVNATGIDSRVIVPGVAQARTLNVVVHAYRNTTRGSALITYRYTSGSTITDGPIPVGGNLLDVSTTFGLTKFQTAQEAGGTSGTYLLFLNGGVTNLYATDLMHQGVGGMSHLFANECSANCQLVVGSYSSSNGVTTVVRDASLLSDADRDGLGNELEASLGTSDTLSDSDADGLPDANEVYGVESARPAHLPAWGADPLQRDVFVEADWQPDYQLTNTQAQAVVDAYAPYIRIHIDTGRTNTDPATRQSYGAWGGAMALAGDPTHCAGWSPEWRKLFHHMVVVRDGGNASSSTCAISDAARFAHELGHQLGLGHGGGDNNNCKPHYVSAMNYAYQRRHRFSEGANMGVVLNPLSLDETRGLGRSAAETAFLSAEPFSYLVNSSGGVDWNRDGVISTGTVQSSLFWNSTWRGCDVGSLRHSHTDTNAQHAALVWESSSKLSMFYRGPSGLLHRTLAASDLATCRTKDACVKYEPPAGTAANIITSDGGWGRIGADWYTINGVNRSLLAYVATEGSAQRVKYRHRASGQTTWTTGSLAHPGGDPGLGGVSVVKIQYGTANQNYVWLFATKLVSGKWVLRSWRYNTAGSGTWDVIDRTESFSDGGSMEAIQAPGVTAGYIKGMSGEQIVAVLQGQDERLYLARYDAANSNWVRLPTSSIPWWNSRAPASIEYVASAADPTNGRYYLTTANLSPLQADRPAILQTEGNDLSPTATSRRLSFGPANQFWNDWTHVHTTTYSVDAPALLFDRRYDSNLRAAFAKNAGVRDGIALMHFFPVADGIVNIDLREYKDYAIMLLKLPTLL